jgi:hypothetical protein
MHHHNDNQPLQANTFPDTPEGRAARRAWLESAPDTHVNHHMQPPVMSWAKRSRDEETFMGIRTWQGLTEPARMAANDNFADDEEEDEAGVPPMLPNVDRDLVDVSAKQLKYAAENGMVRFVGNRLVKVWNGHKWVSPDAEFGEVRQRISDKADTENFDAEIPDVQAELDRTLDVERLRIRLGSKVCTILDMAAGDSTLAEIGEYLGFGGQYATRMAGKAVKDAVAALNTALAEGERAAA